MKNTRLSLKALPLAGILFSGLSVAQSTQVCSYNVYVFGNHTSSYSDVQGRVAVGGNATYTGYDFGLLLSPDPTRYDLVVGGTLKFSNGQIEKGGIVGNGPITITNVTVVGGNVVSGSTVTKNNGTVNGTISQNQFLPVPENFAAAQTFLQSTSTYYGSLIPNAPTVNQWGGLYLTGTDPLLNTFAVSGAMLASVWGVQINVPAGSSVLINVDGVNATLPNVGYNYTNVNSNHVVYNFYQATKLSLVGGKGTVLAPFADITFPHSVVEGTIIGNSLSGNGQVNLAPFTGSLPTPLAGGTFCDSTISGGGNGGRQ